MVASHCSILVILIKGTLGNVVFNVLLKIKLGKIKSGKEIRLRLLLSSHRKYGNVFIPMLHIWIYIIFGKFEELVL